MRRLVLLILAVVCSSAGVFAVEAAPIDIPYLRGLGMGNALNAMPDDHMAILHNPALLATNEFKFIFSPVVAGIDPGTYAVLNDFSNLASIYDLLTGDKAWTALTPELQNTLNQTLSVGGTTSLLGLSLILPSKKIGNIGFGLYNAIDVYGAMSPGTGGSLIPDVHAEVYVDVVGVAGWSHDIGQYIKEFPGKLYGGASLISVNRGQLIVPTVAADSISTSMGYGTGMGFNLGAVYSLPEKDDLRFSLALNNFTSTAINLNDGTSTNIYPSIDLGVSYKPTKIKISEEKTFDFGKRLTLCADIDRFLGGELSKNLHLGLEYSWALVALRLGFNQGLMTYGFRFFNFIEYAAYQEDVDGTTRQVSYLSLDIGF